jgi:hypothetical protein
MVTGETVRLLRWHAGLQPDIAGRQTASVADCVEAADLTEHGLQAAVADFLDAMTALNTELNSSPSGAQSATKDIPRDAAYAVGEVTRLLRDAARSNVRALTFEEGAWLAETAWLAILAGDIEDLREHLVQEKAMRSE